MNKKETEYVSSDRLVTLKTWLWVRYNYRSFYQRTVWNMYSMYLDWFEKINGGILAAFYCTFQLYDIGRIISTSYNVICMHEWNQLNEMKKKKATRKTTCKELTKTQHL